MLTVNKDAPHPCKKGKGCHMFSAFYKVSFLGEGGGGLLIRYPPPPQLISTHMSFNLHKNTDAMWNV